jgi:hypothetical protein
MRANFSESTIKDPVKMADIPIYQGQLVCSLRKLADDWGWSRNKLARFLGWMSKDESITITHHATYTVIAIQNWQKYQGEERAEDERSNEHEPDKRWTESGATQDTRKALVINQNGVSRLTDDTSLGASVRAKVEPASEPPSDTIRRSKEVKKDKKEDCSERSEAGIAPEPKVSHGVPVDLMDLILYGADAKLCRAWARFKASSESAYPGINVVAETRKAHAWEVANPSRQKIHRTRFLNQWFAKAQDNQRSAPAKVGIDATTGNPIGIRKVL